MALFIVVPLTLTLRKLCEIPVTRLIIFEALAVNAGSLLTPIGNPQNILLWGRSGLSFTAFTGQMAPLALAIVASLLAVGWFAFPNKSLQYHSGTTGPSGSRVSSGAAGAVYRFLIALELNQALAGALLVACGFLFLARRVLVSVDWTLLLVFMAMFIDVHLLIQLPVLQNVLHSVGGLSQPGLWLTAIGLSQVISNVPSTILLLNYVPLRYCWRGRSTSAALGCCPARWLTSSPCGWPTIAASGGASIYGQSRCCSGQRRSVSDYSFSYSAQFVSFHGKCIATS